ncbi:MAG: c-type cytochrome domain-containing protein, partial [Planctomycetota bacterium]
MILAVSSLDAWLTFVGTLHPAVLHFPIALGIVAAIVELWGAVRRDPGPSSFALTAVWFAAIVAVVTTTSGWFNAEFLNRGLSLNLFLHRWIGIASAALLITLAISGSIIRARPKASLSGAWRMVLLATAGALGFTGHLGGSMVYGDGYITDALWSAIDQTEKSQRDSAVNAAKAQLGIVETPQVVAAVSATAVSETAVLASVSPAPVVLSAGGKSPVDFTMQIVPILTANCYECHGNGKHKGGVHLDDWKWMTTERKGEWAVKPGDPAASLLLTNIELPASDDSAMPPTG